MTQRKQNSSGGGLPQAPKLRNLGMRPHTPRDLGRKQKESEADDCEADEPDDEARDREGNSRRGIRIPQGLECLNLHNCTRQLLSKSIVDFAAYQMPCVIAGFQQVPQNFQVLLLLGNVAGHMHAADGLPRLVPSGLTVTKK